MIYVQAFITSFEHVEWVFHVNFCTIVDAIPRLVCDRPHYGIKVHFDGHFPLLFFYYVIERGEVTGIGLQVRLHRIVVDTINICHCKQDPIC